MGAGGAYVLSVLAKRQYRLSPLGVGNGEDVALTEEVVVADDAPELLIADTDLYAFKPTTDIVVRGTAYPPRACQEFEVCVRVASSAKRVAVLGRRRILRNGSFSEAAPTEPTTLGYGLAFGGEDSAFLRQAGHPMAAFQQGLAERPELLASNPFAYPRNPCGKGFSMTGSADGLADGADELPQFEDPDDRLTPQRRSAGPDFVWAGQPIPAGLGWFGLLWFPRCVFFGMVPDVPDPHLALEAKRGVIELVTLEQGAQFCTPDVRNACGASPGLSVPWLVGGETLLLENLSAKAPKLEVPIPKGPTRMRIDGRKGKLIDVEPVLSTVLIEPDADSLTLVWRGTGSALRSYSDEELEHMPFEVSW